MANVLAELSPTARKTFIACFLGWTLDAFDFFLLTFVVTRIATDFNKAIPEVAGAITITLMCRPLGAVIFGWFADRFGRRTPLMIDVALFSILELATAFSPNFTVFIVLRALYGIAMGGEWGLGAAMAMEVLPPKRRGFFSGLLQEGYMAGYLLAALAYFAVFHFAPQLGWRALFVIGTLPALLIFYIRAHVPESPTFVAPQRVRPKDAPHVVLTALKAHWPLFVYAIFFMSSLNFLSHGTQDLYATSLQKQRGFDTNVTTTLSVIAAFGAIAGGIIFGALSQRWGRRACVMIAALFGIFAIPLWAFSPSVTLLAIGAFVMQFMVQGAWGVIPAHLNELSPPDTRGTFPGFTYQIGNLISAGAAQMEAAFATSKFPLPSGVPDYGKAMAIIAAICFVAVFIFAALGYLVKPENKDSSFLEPAPEWPPDRPKRNSGGKRRKTLSPQPFYVPKGLKSRIMISTRLSIASLNINKKAKDRLVEEPSEPVYGGYANARGEIFLFGEDLVYRVNFKNQTLQQRPPLNAGAQARYDAAAAGEPFEYCNVSFRRLDSTEIKKICSSGAFRVTPKFA